MTEGNFREHLLQTLDYLWENQRGKTIGCSFGLLLGILILLFGFWNIIFILLCGVIGLYIGMCIDRSDDFLEILSEKLPDKLQHWR